MKLFLSANSPMVFFRQPVGRADLASELSSFRRRRREQHLSSVVSCFETRSLVKLLRATGLPGN
jgi:hypothetical protein